MQILVFGLNFKTAPVAVREHFAIAEAQVSQALAQLRQAFSIHEVVLLSTCNRTEVLALVSDVELAQQALQVWFSNLTKGRVADGDVAYERYVDAAALAYLLRLSCGLESLVIGEYQILGQLKTAFAQAQASGTSGTVLNKLYHHVVAAGKRARSETTIGVGSVSVASAAVELAEQIFSDLSQHTALVLGAGDMADLALTHLYEHGLRRVVVANRTLSKAEELAQRWQGRAATLEQLETILPEADLVIASTAAPEAVLGLELMRGVMRARAGRPLLIIDIAVPRDVASEVGKLDDVYLYNVDDLKQIVAEHRDSRMGELSKVQNIVAEEQAKFLAWQEAQDLGGVIQKFSAESEEIRIAFLQGLNGKLSSDEKTKFDVLTKQLVNKLLHGPIMALKAGVRSEGEQTR